MASALRSKLGELASAFASEVLHAIRSASIEDLQTASSGGGRLEGAPRASARGRAPVARPGAAPGVGLGGGGRLPRRSAGDISGMVDRIVELLRGSPKGLRAEQIRQKLGVRAKELPRPLKEGVAAGRLGRSGQKRATTYVVKSAPAARAAKAGKAVPAPAPRPARPAKKAARPARKAASKRPRPKAAKKK